GAGVAEAVGVGQVCDGFAAASDTHGGGGGLTGDVGVAGGPSGGEAFGAVVEVFDQHGEAGGLVGERGEPGGNAAGAGVDFVGAGGDAQGLKEALGVGVADAEGFEQRSGDVRARRDRRSTLGERANHFGGITGVV